MVEPCPLGVNSMLMTSYLKVGPSGCALAKKENETGSDIMARVEEFQASLYDTPLPAPNASLPGILSYGRGRCESNYRLKGLCLTQVPVQSSGSTSWYPPPSGPTPRKPSTLP